MTEPPAKWLGEEKYQSLAVNMIIPRDSRRMLSEIKMGNADDPWALWPSAAVANTKAMSVAMAYAYERQSGGSPGQPQARLEAIMEWLRRFGYVETS